jgi:hypothetical protein
MVININMQLLQLRLLSPCPGVPFCDGDDPMDRRSIRISVLAIEGTPEQKQKKK